VLKKIVQKLKAGEMPPPGMPGPDKADIDKVTGWISDYLKDNGENAKQTDRRPIAGRVTAHRLNRTEYNNTVRDLLGVDFQPADDFPQDDSGYGFDNIGDVLSLSPVLMEKYLAAAEKVARGAVFGPPPMQATLVRARTIQRYVKNNPKPLFDYDETGLTLANAVHLTYKFPVDAEYVIRARLAGQRPAGSEAIQMALWIDGKEQQAVSFDPGAVAMFERDRQDLWAMSQEFRLKLTAGNHWISVAIPHLYEGLPPSYGGPNPSKRPIPPPPVFEPPPGVPPDRVAELKKEFDKRQAEVVPANGPRINSIEIGGPYNEAKGPSPASLKDIYVCGDFDGHHRPGCARKIVAALARRAYRHPVTPQEVDKLVGLVSMAQKQGDSFEEGLTVAIEAMLVSPHFLFRIESDPYGTGSGSDRVASKAFGSHPLNQYELASRLSYFLWSSMPDDELLSAADKGILNQPAVLEAEVKRMLQDPKSGALAENFGGQWLELRKLDSAKPDRQKFPQWDEYLRWSMRRETEMFFENVMHQDRSIFDFIDGNYTFLNEQLADFYHIPGVKGAEFRKVELAPNINRAGILTQASVLTVSSYATRTSPVLRGKWILENILDDPPPPPPPDVPNLDESKIGSTMSLREQLELHRKNAICASCHSRMDPLGFGLENFNAIGAWRTMDGKFQIDSSGTLPNGKSFKGPRELEAIVMADPSQFTKCFARKLLTYALGRGLEKYDDAPVQKIVANAAAHNYRLSSVVMGIVDSLPFEDRSGEVTP
ncbi:MAG TPA: DUF1592 domain-containing protein, partial [Blastocatellia bacterium]|nr:DUF1592 domain-containing protein [Blastocatellia bacterium]